MNYFTQFPEEIKVLILKIAIWSCVFVILAFVFIVVRHKIRRSYAKLKKNKAQIEEHEIDTVRTTTLTRS